MIRGLLSGTGRDTKCVQKRTRLVAWRIVRAVLDDVKGPSVIDGWRSRRSSADSRDRDGPRSRQSGDDTGQLQPSLGHGQPGQ
jgi:hypothetical protein